ncbi:MAG: phosphoribosylformylglycinamidine synthase, partial [Clostridia bacterium]|nr:phosphoribosylformylglycinamidine synthase [Clostridia bacterium]
MRIFVEKRKGFDVEAMGILADIRDSLGINSIETLRVFNRYDVEGLTEEQFETACKTILSETNVDMIYKTLELTDCRTFGMEYLAGQYDQRADSAAQCIALLTGEKQPNVKTATIISMTGDITDAEFDKIKKYLINPVESCEALMEEALSLDIKADEPEDIKIVEGFIAWNEEKIGAYHKSMGFAMSIEDLKHCQKYFRDTEKRDPHITELKVIDTYWSDHCRHTTFLTKLENVEIEESKLKAAIENAWIEYITARAEVYGSREKNITLMDIATIGTKLLKKQGYANNLDESDEINACSIEVPVEIDGKTEQWLVQFKNETHNHPTEIEPFGGAATCLGGAIRDPLSGRAYVYQAMRVTGSGDPRISFEDTLEGKLTQKKITTTAAAGYSSYGNQIGLATGQVVEIYHEGYVAKRMEIGAVIGAAPKKNVIRMT